MRSVLISIQPQWCELIASGKKTIEVRKTKPKINTPFKVYIYETRAKCDRPIMLDFGVLDFHGRGQVVGEFVCDAIISHCEMANADISEQHGCIKREKLLEYANGKELYGWHISDLVIYDKPRELGEFRTVDNEAVKRCEHRERVYNNPDYTNGAFLPGSYICNKDEPDWCTKCKTKPLKRPPQSWCYVEETVGDV